MESFRLSLSGTIQEQILAVFARAKREGFAALAARAAKCLLEELKSNPNELGESRYRLDYAELDVRIAFIRPFIVEFGIHEKSKTVFIAKVRWTKPKIEASLE